MPTFYKVVRNYRGRLFSSTSVWYTVKLIIQKRKRSASVGCVEYKRGKWTFKPRSGPMTYQRKLFVTTSLEEAKNMGGTIYECSVTNPTLLHGTTYLVDSVKLGKRIGNFY